MRPPLFTARTDSWLPEAHSVFPRVQLTTLEGWTQTQTASVGHARVGGSSGPAAGDRSLFPRPPPCTGQPCQRSAVWESRRAIVSSPRSCSFRRDTSGMTERPRGELWGLGNVAGGRLILSSCFRPALTEPVRLWRYQEGWTLRTASGDPGPQVFILSGSGLPRTLWQWPRWVAAEDPGWKAPDSETPRYHFCEAQGTVGKGRRSCCVWHTELASGLNQAHTQGSRWKTRGCRF